MNKNKVNKANKVNKPITIEFENKRLPVYYFIPLLLIAGFIPLVVYAKYIDLAGTTQSLYWTGQQQYLDFFSYWKSKWVMILTAISLIIYVVLYKDKKLPFKNLKQYYIPLSVYAVFVILSTIFAKDKSIALWGFVDMYQGMFVLLSYVLLTFLTINFVNSERDVSLFAKAFLFLIIVEGIIGITQYFGFDFFQTSLGKNLIIPSNLQVEDLSFSFGPKTIYGTLFNTNFVGSFATLMLPLSVAFLMCAKNIKQRVITGITVVLSIFLWIGCNSRAGYLGVTISAIVAVILFRKLIIKHWKASLILFAVLIALFFGLNFLSDGAILNRIKTLNLNQLEAIKEQNENTLKFEDIVLGKDTFSIKTNKETLNFKVDKDRLFFLDENNNEMIITTKGNQISINDERYSGYSITMADKYPGLLVNAYGKLIKFYITQDGIKIIGSGGRLTEPKSSPFFEPLRGLETLGSNRGYEWGTTIPMLKNYVLIGSGPDNFPIVFNQDDFIRKLNLIDFDANIVVDKPHNMYLQTGINTGVISLVSLLVLVVIYLFVSLKLYSKAAFNAPEEIIGGACLLSIIEYLSAGIFNDSITSVAPLFWIVLGIGIS
ncbi:MAG: O-antigen ligase family protein, partial [Tissierellia bacterium]|nr:O-antigen ligase family protein [Tissierellia bacterium]